MYKATLAQLCLALFMGLVAADQAIERAEVLKCAASVEPQFEDLQIPSAVKTILDRIRLFDPDTPFSAMAKPDERFRTKYIGDSMPEGCNELLAKMQAKQLHAECLLDLLEEHDLDDQVLEIFWSSSERLDQVMGSVSVCSYMDELLSAPAQEALA